MYEKKIVNTQTKNIMRKNIVIIYVYQPILTKFVQNI